MADTKLEDDCSKKAPEAADGISRRKLLKVGGKAAVGAAVFGPFILTSKAAATKPLSFWQFYAPGGAAGDRQSKWFVDCVTAWNATPDGRKVCSVPPGQFRRSNFGRNQSRGMSRRVTISWLVTPAPRCGRVADLCRTAYSRSVR